MINILHILLGNVCKHLQTKSNNAQLAKLPLAALLHLFLKANKPQQINRTSNKKLQENSPPSFKNNKDSLFLFKNRFSQEDRFAPHCAGCFAGTAARACVAVGNGAAGRGAQFRSGSGSAGGQVHWPTDRRPAAKDAGWIWRWSKKVCVCFWVFF